MKFPPKFIAPLPLSVKTSPVKYKKVSDLMFVSLFINSCCIFNFMLTLLSICSKS
jgi:hypothetical protein